MVAKIIDPSKLEFNSGTPGLNKVLLADNIITSLDEPIIIQQGATGIQFEDTSSTNQITLTHDGTNIVKSKAASTDTPIEQSNVPFHMILEGTDAPLDLTTAYDDGLSFVKYNYTSTGGTGAAVNRTAAYAAEVIYNSSDAYAIVQGFIQGYTSDITLSQPLSGSLGNSVYGYRSTIDISVSGLDSNLDTFGFSSALTGTISGTVDDVLHYFTSPTYTSGSVDYHATLFSTMMQTSGAGSISNNRGIYINPAQGTSGTITTMIVADLNGGSVTGNLINNTITDYYGLLTSMPASGTGSVTNAYGIFVPYGNNFATNSYEIFLDDAGGIFFRDSAISVSSDTDGHLDLTADLFVNLNTAEIDASSASMVVRDIGLGGTAAAPFVPLNIDVTGSTYVAALIGNVEYTGSGTLSGSFQSTMVYNGSGATPTTYGSLLGSYLEVDNRSSFTLSTNTASSCTSGFNDNSAVLTGGVSVFFGQQLSVLPASNLGGTHTGSPTIYAIGLDIAPIQTPAGVGTFYKAGIRCRDHIDIYPDAVLSFDAAATANGDSTIYYDSASSELRCDVDGTQAYSIDTNADVVFDNEVSGTRDSFGGGDNADITSSKYLKQFNGTLMTASLGYYALRSGSVTGVGVTFNCSVGILGDSAFEVFVKINGTNSLGTGAVSTSSTGNKKGGATASRNTHTFSAGDVLSLYVVRTGSPTGNDFCATAEIVYD